jgi:hypothetical protein
MKHKGPIITLAAGLIVAAVLMVMNLNVSRDAAAKEAANSAADAPAANIPAINDPTATTPPATATATATATAAPPAAASPPAVVAQPPAVGTQITFAGTVDGSAATLAIAIKDGKAVAYLCDGKTAEAWLKGTATSGQLNLTGASEATLTGTFGENTASGDVSAAGKQFTFSIKPVTEPSGLYRSTSNVRNAQLVGGWIVLPNGKQVGLAKLDGNTIAVPPLDTTSKSATVDGVTVSAGRLDGTGL